MSNPQNVINFRKRIKIALVKACGEKCQYCNQTFEPYVYDFHHKNPEEKNFGIAGQGITHSKADVAKEAKKCIMVCANCHRIIEYENIDCSNIDNIFNEEIYYQTLEELTNKNSKIIKETKSQIISKKPERSILKEQIRTMPFLQIGKFYGVSDNAIRKWCISYGLPSRVTDIKNISDEDWKQI
jgi:hypothetical protein